jgi:hypothetical protein
VQQRVLATAVSDDEDLHGGETTREWG